MIGSMENLQELYDSWTSSIEMCSVAASVTFCNISKYAAAVFPGIIRHIVQTPIEFQVL